MSCRCTYRKNGTKISNVLTPYPSYYANDLNNTTFENLTSTSTQHIQVSFKGSFIQDNKAQRTQPDNIRMLFHKLRYSKFFPQRIITRVGKKVLHDLISNVRVKYSSSTYYDTITVITTKLKYVSYCGHKDNNARYTIRFLYQYNFKALFDHCEARSLHGYRCFRIYPA